MPGAQSVHAGRPLKEKPPASQGAHELEAKAPAEGEYRPAGQSEHAAWPPALWKAPAVQLRQEPHPAPANLPAAQSTHDEFEPEPTAPELLPGLHGWHRLVAAVPRLKDPAGQEAQADEPEAAANLPAPQFEQAAAVEALYWPAAHTEQRAAAVAEEVPAAHATHSAAPATA